MIEVVCDCEYRFRAIGMTGRHTMSCAVTKEALRRSVSGETIPDRCPDSGACHHLCAASGAACFRVSNCGPLSGVFPDDQWPASVINDAEAHGRNNEVKPDPLTIMIDLKTVLGEADEEYTLRDAIVLAAADKLIESMHQSHREAIGRQVAEVDAVVATEIRMIVREALSKPIQRRSPWGEKSGQETTVLEIAREKLEAFLARPSQRDPYGRSGDKPNNLADLLDEIVKNALTKDFRDTITEAKKQINSQLRVAISEAVAEKLAK